ncbi:hypothetical protein [Flavisphingomonas formosensis]|uniref:hypothetical protein n=1 Tax=Flavisphingomonas formosensis TaxID=861534 RepID=UPI0012F91D49|nr:hypothetical protein [Sphingomonas formosensis]
MSPPTRYSPALIPAARTFAERGALDKDLAAAFGVHFKTIREWKQRHPDFAAACKLGRDAADAAVERALFRRATGYDRETERVFLRDGTLVRVAVTEHVPPCDKAATFWLRVRRPDRWDPPPVIRHADDDALSSTEEALRDIEEDAYEAMCAAQDGGPEMDGDEDGMARIDALDPGPVSPADDGDPLVGLTSDKSYEEGRTIPSRHPDESRDPLAAASRLVGNAAANGSWISEATRRAGMTKKEEAADTLPRRIHPPLPDPIAVPLVEPIDAAPSAPGSKYDPTFVPIARQLAEQGALDRDLARAFGISLTTLRQWTLRHAAFGQAVRLGKSVADDAVEAALFARATGYAYMRETVLLTDAGEVLRGEILVQQPPSLPAMLFWLDRRRTDRWSPLSPSDLDPDEAAALIAETRERVAEYDLHRRHWRTHGCAPPDRDEPAPPDWLWDEEDLSDEEDDDVSNGEA